MGALGRMGERVIAAVEAEPALELHAALEAADHPQLGCVVGEGVKVAGDVEAALSGCDVAIDFAVPAATLRNLRAAAAAGVAYVTGTTGFDDAELAEIEHLARRIPVVHAANFSLSVNVLVWLAERASRKRLLSGRASMRRGS